MRLVLLGLLFAISAAARSESVDPLARQMEALRYFAAQSVDFNYELELQSRRLFLDYDEILSTPSGPQTAEMVRILAHDFALDFMRWSLLVAQATGGSEADRLYAHRSFCMATFGELSRYGPKPKSEINSEFRQDFLDEMDWMAAKLDERVSHLTSHHLKKNGPTTVTEGLTCTLVALTSFQLVQQIAGSPLAADLVGAMSFFGTLGLLKNYLPVRLDRELVAQKIALESRQLAPTLCGKLLQAQVEKVEE
jgi:hypothetical protein